MMFKGILVGLVALVFASGAYADVPRLINYQGRIMDSNGVAIPDSTPSITFRLYDGSGVQMGSPVVWQEVKDIQTKNGYFNVVLGDQMFFSAANLSFDIPYYLGIKVGGDPEMTPRIALNSVPSAMQIPDNTITTAKLTSGAVMGGNIGGNTITASNIANGTITSNKIASGTITSGNIAASTISGGNIATGTIANGNIANGAVDQAKAPFAPRVVVAGSLRNNPIIATGSSTTDVNGDIGVSLAGYGFTAAPYIQLTPRREPFSTSIFITVYNISTTNFAVRAIWGDGNGCQTDFHWLAVGY